MPLMKSLALPGLFAALMASTPAIADDIRFYAANGCRGNVVFRYRANATVSHNCKKSGHRCSGHNDVVRSLWMPNSGAWIVTVYDSPDAETDDDYTKIMPSRSPHPNGGVCISSFERNTPDVTYRRHNGLDGKVSHVSINTIRLR